MVSLSQGGRGLATRNTPISEVREAVSRYVHWYNEERPHSSLRYKSPMEYHSMLAA
ncbi:integrase core domain-containing protein [Kroppenstedtia sanguinis]|uniref:Integrase core domain-containing protein n=1 Tax=Kroppenstedtia sanguinis TaxID=1380684 RepID=A0ABW4CCX3_9BACL